MIGRFGLGLGTGAFEVTHTTSRFSGGLSVGEGEWLSGAGGSSWPASVSPTSAPGDPSGQSDAGMSGAFGGSGDASSISSRPSARVRMTRYPSARTLKG
jgi:hypothetical protein